MLARHLAVSGAGAQQLVTLAGMDHAELRAQVRDYFRAQLEEGKQRINAAGPLRADQKQAFSQSLGMLEEGNAEFWHLVGSDHARRELDAFFTATGLPREKFRDRIPQVLDELRKARIGMYKAMQQHAEGLETYDFTEAVRAAESALETEDAGSGYPSISEAVQTFFRVHEKSSDWTPGTFQKRQTMLATAVEWFGPETSMGDISKRDAAGFKEMLLSLPKSRATSPRLRDLSLREALEVPGVERISNTTVNAHLSACRIFWDWAEKHDYAPEVLFTGLSVASKGHGSKERGQFSQEALEKAYTALTDPGSRFYGKTSHRWATLIAMHSGARLNEVCQLRVDDVIQVDGIWAFDFNEEGDPDKRLKSAAAKRRVPVHSKLIDLGFLKFREAQAARGHERLFPEYRYSPKHGYGDALSKWFNRTFTQGLGIKTEAHVFHGLRHTFATRLFQADVATEMVQFIVGHERESVTHQVYAKEAYTLQQTQKAVERFTVAIS